METDSRISVWLKIIYLVSFTLFFVVGAAFLLRLFIRTQIKPGENVLLETDYQMALWKGFGEVFEPIVKLPIYYPGGDFKKEAFLLDSGAVVSSLPREKASELGFSLAKLPRSTFAGFGGTLTFAYKADLRAQLGQKEVTLPVVFTEAAGTKPILGRSGFFEDYSVYFDSKARKIQIKE